MKAEGFASVMASSLVCNIPGADWHFSIRRVDERSHGPFCNFHQKEVSSVDIATFLPNWETLQWTTIKDNMLSKSESYAKDVEFRINIQAAEASSKTHADVIKAFIDFMRGA